MEAARLRRANAEMTVKRMAAGKSQHATSTPGSSSSDQSSGVGKRIRGKSSYTPNTTPSTKTPDAKAIKMLSTPGEAKKALFVDGDGA